MNAFRGLYTRGLYILSLVSLFGIGSATARDSTHPNISARKHRAHTIVFMDPPLLLSPENGSVGQSLDIDLHSNYLLPFAWYRYPDYVAQDGAVESPRIEFQIAPDSTFGSNLVIDTIFAADDTTSLIGGLGFNLKYYWRIRPLFTLVNIPWSDIWNFRTAAAPKLYPPFIQTAPVFGSSTNPMQMQHGGYPTIQFIWNPYPSRLNDDGSIDHPYYLLQLSTDSNAIASGTIPLQIFGSDDSVGRMIIGLIPDVKYYWRMRAGYSLGGAPWSQIGSFTGTTPATTVQEIQQVDSLSLHIADSLQTKSPPKLQQSRLQNFLYTVTVQCLVPADILTKGDLTLIVADTGSAALPWHELMVQIDPWIGGYYSDYNVIGLSYQDYLNTRASLAAVHTGDILSVTGFIVETPANSYMSNTVLLCVKLSPLGHSDKLVPPLPASAADFYTKSNIHFSTGEQYEGSVIELRDLSVYSILDGQAGTFEVIDGAGNIMATTDYSCWFTLASHRNPASSYIPPHPGAHINLLRGAIVTTNGQYCIAPLLPGDIVLGPDIPHLIRGYVYDDYNLDSMKENNEPSLSNITATLTGKRNVTVLSDSNGVFTFSQLDSGAYTVVCQSPGPPWHAPPNTNRATSFTFSANPETIVIYFGFYRPWNHISGKVFDDLNEDGEWNNGEPGLANWSVKLSGHSNDSVLTDTSGNYSFLHVESGQNLINLYAQPQWEQIYPRSWEQYTIGSDTLGASFPNINFAIHRIPVRIKLRLTVHDNSYRTVQKLLWGNRGGATYGIWGVDPHASTIDFAEEETELPPVSYPLSFHFFDARFQDPRGDSSRFGEGAWVDMRDFYTPAQIDTHLVAFLPGYNEGGDYPMTLAWDRDQVAAAYSGKVLLVDPLGTTTDMKLSDSLVIRNRAIKSILIIAEGPNLPFSSQMGWHIVSIPALPLVDGGIAVFQLTQSDPYAYNRTIGYEVSKPMIPGRGYWLKCIPDKKNTYNLAAPPLLPETLAIAKGWNIIGAPQIAISTPDIATIPSNIAGTFFSYQWSYEMADSLKPFEGYWVKAKQNGSMIIGTVENKYSTTAQLPEHLITIIFQDGRGNKHQLYVACTDTGANSNIDIFRYELPPLPPNGSSDIRFSSGRNLEYIPAGKCINYQIQITGDIVFPLTINCEHSSADSPLECSIRSGSKVIQLKGGARIIIDNLQDQISLQVENKMAGALPKEFRLEQNYPNPFNPLTIIQYALPATSHVRLVIFNVLGQVVQTLVNEIQDGGLKEAQWNAANMPSGVYFYRLEGTPLDAPHHQVRIDKKMLLIK
ncbi:MAG: SdrD B-like domain-containing protein [Bacteroidota bacterium]